MQTFDDFGHFVHGIENVLKHYNLNYGAWVHTRDGGISRSKYWIWTWIRSRTQEIVQLMTWSSSKYLRQDFRTSQRGASSFLDVEPEPVPARNEVELLLNLLLNMFLLSIKPNPLLNHKLNLLLEIFLLYMNLNILLWHSAFLCLTTKQEITTWFDKLFYII